jgi:hypothetical protein
MQNCGRKPSGRRMLSHARGGLLVIAAAALLISACQSACSKKSKATAVAPSDVRTIILPMNVPAGVQDLRWTAMAGPILMGIIVERARDLQVVPLWESMPTAIEAAGVGRSFTPDTAAAAAGWLSAKWAVMGDISTTKTGVHMVLDFIPAKTGTVPFRYTKSGSIDDAGARISDGFVQFAYYLTIRPLEPPKKKLPAMTSLKKLAEALDREYGWFVEAGPGKAQAVVSELAGSDPQLARFLFNPGLYSTLAAK